MRYSNTGIAIIEIDFQFSFYLVSHMQSSTVIFFSPVDFSRL